ncbi:hypothetical protein [Oscillatoria sp. FACHB-1406]|uniref:hypothetical protein n=1 Tax=Oscillatoria sp. FACHB-1406 TaxID=2692846 RepID=UPI001683FB79|nr:hypothetical protein [Oscillatoria sp. FACHB-1406]MBD2580562.1 hypothetical protein [Oscillatoria sp. FACHB-1406]
MKLNSLLATATLVGLATVSTTSIPLLHGSNGLQPAQAQTMMMPAMDATGLTSTQKIENLTQHKGKFGSGDELRRYFFGDLEPISVQPGGAGMVVNLYNKANNVTFAYCSTYDVVVAVKQGKVTTFAPDEVK